MSRTKGHIIILLGDILALLCFWLGCHRINQVVVSIASSADSVEFNNKVGLLFTVVLVPIIHLYAIYEYIWPKVVEKKGKYFNRSVLILLIVLVVSGFFISVRVQTYVERAGYLHCPQADYKMTFSTGLVYTKDAAICSQLAEEKREP